MVHVCLRVLIYFPSISCQAAADSSFPSGIFAGTKITPEALVQTLKFEEPPDVPIPAQKGKTCSSLCDNPPLPFNDGCLTCSKLCNCAVAVPGGQKDRQTPNGHYG